MSTTTLSVLVTELKFNARVQSSEGFTDPGDFQKVVADAVRLHNSTYVATTVSCTVPEVEKDVVGLLAWARLCMVRASRFATDSNASGQGWGTDRNTPFYKCLELHKILTAQYTEGCKALGLTVFAGAGAIALSEVTCENLDMGAQTPIEMSLTPPVIRLYSTPTTAVNSNGTLAVYWEQANYSNFAKTVLVHVTGSTSVYDAGNYASAVLPRIIDTAAIVGTVTNPDIRALNLTDIAVTPGIINRFLVASVSKSGKYTYSNEIVLTQP